jgi:hypothetical protein
MHSVKMKIAIAIMLRYGTAQKPISKFARA